MSNERKCQLFWGVWTVVMVVACGLVTVSAAAQSVPASQPGVPGMSWLEWCQANSAWLVPLVVGVVSSLITGLTKYPKAGGVVAALQLFLSVFSAVTHKDAPGTFKLPLTPTTKPSE